jgi:hypothetical protein
MKGLEIDKIVKRCHNESVVDVLKQINMQNISEQLTKREIYLDYPFEEAMVKSVPPKDPKNPEDEGGYFLKFYGWADEQEVKGDHIMLNEVLRFGEEITKSVYEKGKKSEIY